MSNFPQETCFALLVALAGLADDKNRNLRHLNLRNLSSGKVSRLSLVVRAWWSVAGLNPPTQSGSFLSCERQHDPARLRYPRQTLFAKVATHWRLFLVKPDNTSVEGPSISHQKRR